jgi:hypothetical protein
MRSVVQTSVNAKGATAVVTRCGCRWVAFFEGSEIAIRGSGARTDGFVRTSRELRNVSNLMTGSRVQQTCRVAAEQTAEVVRDHKGGTRRAEWYQRAKAVFRDGGSGRSGVEREKSNMEGDDPQLRLETVAPSDDP